ncbi:MAG: ribonuclease P protein component [Thermodesulfobacteriota bacterium]
MRFFFNKTDRILKRSDYLRLQQTGNKIQNNHFIASFGPGRFNRSRLGITVTKKVGNAATRNKIKRMSREFFRLNRHQLTGSWDIVIIAKKEAVNLTADQTFSSLQNVFDRIPKNLAN